MSSSNPSPGTSTGRQRDACGHEDAFNTLVRAASLLHPEGTQPPLHPANLEGNKFHLPRTQDELEALAGWAEMLRQPVAPGPLEQPGGITGVYVIAVGDPIPVDVPALHPDYFLLASRLIRPVTEEQGKVDWEIRKKPPYLALVDQGGNKEKRRVLDLLDGSNLKPAVLEQLLLRAAWAAFEKE